MYPESRLTGRVIGVQRRQTDLSGDQPPLPNHIADFV